MRNPIAFLLAATFLLVAPPAVQAQTSIFNIRSGMVQFLLSQISSPGSFEVTVESVDSPSSGTTRLNGLKIADGEGVWLTAEIVSMTWNSSRLLRGEIDIPQILVENLDVLRPPSPNAEPPELAESEETGTPSPFDWPRSPLNLRISEMKLVNIHVAEGVLPQAITFDALGSAVDEGNEQSLKLNVTRTDTVQGDILLDYLRDFSQNTLRLKLDAEEAAGGLVAALAGFPDDSRTTVHLSADGPKEDWKVDFDAEVQRVFDADGTATVSYVAPLSVLADFNLRPGPELSQEVRDVIGAEASLNARVIEEGDVIRIEDLDLTSPELTLTGDGTYGRSDGAMDLVLDLEGRSGLARLAEGVDFQSFGFKGTVQGTPEDLQAKGETFLYGLKTEAADAGSLDLDVDVTRQGTRLTFDVSGAGRDMRLDKLSPATVGPVDLAVAGWQDGDTLELGNFSFASPLMEIRANGTTDMAFQDSSFDFSAQLPDAGPIAAAYGQQVTGAADLSGHFGMQGGQPSLDARGTLENVTSDMADLGRFDITATLDSGTGGMAFDVNGKAERMRIDRLGPDLLGTADLVVTGTLDGNALTLSEASLVSPPLGVRSSGTLDLETVSGTIDYTVRAPDIAPVAAAYDQSAAGALEADGAVTLSDGVPRIAGTAGLAGFVFDGSGYGDFDVTHDVTAGAVPEGTVALDLTGGPFGQGRVATGFRYDAPTVTVSGFDAALLGLKVTGDVTGNTEAMLATGGLKISSADLRPLGRFAGTDLAGRLNGTLDLSTPEGRQAATLRLDANGIAVPGVGVETARVEAGVTDATGTPVLRVKTDVGYVDFGRPGHLDGVTLTANGPLSRLQVVLDTEGEVKDSALTAGVTGTVSANGGDVRATLTRLTTTFDGETFAQEGPLGLRSSGGVISVSDLALSMPNSGMVRGDTRYSPAGVVGTLDLSAIDLSILSRLAGLGIDQGTLNGTADFDTRPGSARAEADITIAQMLLEGVPPETEPFDTRATLNWNGREADVTAEMKGSFDTPLRLEANVPLRAARPFPALNQNGPLSGTLEWEGELTPLWAIVPAPDHVLNGDALVDLRFGGTPASPTVGGEVSLSDGRYQNLAYGVILTDVNIRSQIDESASGIDNLGLQISARDGNTGTVDGDARLRMGEGVPELDFTLKADRAVLIRRDDVTARISSDISVAGPLNMLAVTGEARINRAEVRLINNTPPSIVTLGDVRIKGAPLPEEEEESQDNRIDLDVTISAPNGIFVRGRGLDSEWMANLHVGGTASVPRVTGAIERLRGQFDLVGSTFQLDTGKILFNGSRNIDPDLDVVLKREANEITGYLSVTGAASDPQISFSSEPELPSDEVLPRLLFGTSKQSLSAAQAIQIAVGIQALTSGERGPIDMVRDAVGVDVLRVDTTDEGAELTVGQNLAPGVFVGATTQVQGEGNDGVTVEIDLFNGVKATGEAGTLSSNVGLEWRKDF